MARQGKPRPKVLSSGRLTGGGRGQVNKKTVVGRHVKPFEPAYSLYSTDSEDQVTTVHKGLDCCAALLDCILQAEKKESPVSKACLKSHFPKTALSKTKSKLVPGKLEADRKKLGKKLSSVANMSRKPVQKTILSSQSYPGSRGQPSTVDVEPKPDITTKRQTSVTQPEQIQPHYLPLACPGSGGSNIIPSTELQAATVFNCRLTTSTPTLSPPRPTSAHSQVSQRGSDGQLHYFTQQRDLGTGGQSSRHEAKTHYTASLSVSPAVQQLPGGPTISVQQAMTIPEAKAELRVPSPLLSAPHMVGLDGPSTPLESCTGSLTCPSPTMATHSPLIHLQTHSQPMLVCADPQEQQLSCKESLDECGGCSSEGDELALVDSTPVRDTSCQTSMNKPTAMFNQDKTFSPEKTARKVMTVKYLLGELKTLVANQDSEAVRLISEVEQSISLLPAMVGSTNVQAELALALQPLRSENVQLRRRLRILNQQLLERERAERQSRPVDCTLELATLQSLNLTLQTQLSDSGRELRNMQQDNQRLQQALEDKENDLQQSKEQYELETSRIRLDVSEALAEMRSCQTKLELSEREKIALTLRVQQKEAEITKLEEIIRTLEKSCLRDTDRHLAQADVPKPPSQLTKSVLDFLEDHQKETAVTDRVSDTVKTYLQTLEGTKQSPPPHHFRNLSSPSTDQCGGRIESCRLHESKSNSSAGIEVLEGGGSDSAFVPLRETVRVQTAAITQTICPEQTNESKWVDGASGHSGLKYLGVAFEKPGLSPEDLKALDGIHYLLHADCVSSELKPTNEGTADLSQQSQNDRRLQMGDESAYIGRNLVFENTLSSCDIKSLASDWSVNSCSTFNTRDEQNFRNGLAALDASIASIQRTLKAELKK